MRVTFEDTGPGLPPEKLAQLFQPFNRLGQESGTEEGTGIGLVVSKRLIELMGGAIGAMSTVGVGSTFWIELDAAAAPNSVDLQDSSPFLAPEATQTRPARPCSAEDNPANLLLIEKLIARRPDIRLLSARDAERGIQIARSRQPDVILMDINLPGMSGLEALRWPVTRELLHACDRASANAMARTSRRGSKRASSATSPNPSRSTSSWKRLIRR